MFDLIKNRYGGDGYLVLGEVRWATGYGTKSERRADAIVMSLWPSRGLTVTGFEFKASRADWLSELKNPEKNDGWVQFCDYWYLVTAEKAIAKPHEIPEPWGWMTGKKRLRTEKPGPKNENPVRDTGTWFSLLRRAMEITDGDRQNILGRAREAERESVKRGFERDEESLKRIKADQARREADLEVKQARVNEYIKQLNMYNFDAKKLDDLVRYWTPVNLREAQRGLELIKVKADKLNELVRGVDKIFNPESIEKEVK